jgi:hypothetical protein
MVFRVEPIRFGTATQLDQASRSNFTPTFGVDSLSDDRWGQGPRFRDNLFPYGIGGEAEGRVAFRDQVELLQPSLPRLNRFTLNDVRFLEQFLDGIPQIIDVHDRSPTFSKTLTAKCRASENTQKVSVFETEPHEVFAHGSATVFDPRGRLRGDFLRWRSKPQDHHSLLSVQNACMTNSCHPNCPVLAKKELGGKRLSRSP